MRCAHRKTMKTRKMLDQVPTSHPSRMKLPAAALSTPPGSSTRDRTHRSYLWTPLRCSSPPARRGSLLRGRPFRCGDCRYPKGRCSEPVPPPDSSGPPGKLRGRDLFSVNNGIDIRSRSRNRNRKKRRMYAIKARSSHSQVYVAPPKKIEAKLLDWRIPRATPHQPLKEMLGMKLPSAGQAARGLPPQAFSALPACSHARGI